MLQPASAPESSPEDDEYRSEPPVPSDHLPSHGHGIERRGRRVLLNLRSPVTRRSIGQGQPPEVRLCGCPLPTCSVRPDGAAVKRTVTDSRTNAPPAVNGCATSNDVS